MSVESIHRDRICLVGIAIVVNDAVPFRYPGETDMQSLSELNSAKLADGTSVGVEMNGERMKKARSQFWRLIQATFAEMFLPPNAEELYGDNLEVVIDHLRLVCFPLRTTAKSKTSSLVSFSVVLALDASFDSIVEQSRAKLRTEPTPTAYGEAYPLSLAGIRPYRTIARDLAKALLYTENLEGFLTKETKRALEENCLTTSLQNELKSIYHGLIEFGTASLKLPDGRLCASFNLLDARLKPTMSLRPYHAVMVSNQPNEDNAMARHHPTTSSSNYPSSANTTSLTSSATNVTDHDEAPTREFAAYFRKWGAMKSLADAADDLGISLEQACRFAAHLRQWERARIVHKLEDWSMFYVTPDVDLRRTSNPLFAQFASRFPGQDLARVLAKVTEPRPSTLIPRKLKDFEEFYGENARPMFSWLMRNKLIIEVFQFIYFVPATMTRSGGARRSSFTAVTEPPSPSSSAASSSPPPSVSQPSTPTPSASNAGFATSSSSSRGSPSVKTLLDHMDGKMLTTAQLAYLKSVWDLNNPVFRMFLKLCPLFGGMNHIQEIISRTGISIGALKIVLEQYSDCLFVSIHELST